MKSTPQLANSDGTNRSPRPHLPPATAVPIYRTTLGTFSLTKGDQKLFDDMTCVDVLEDWIHRSGGQAFVEPRQDFWEDRRRPDIRVVLGAQAYLIDVRITHPTSRSCLPQACQGSLRATISAANQKRRRFDTLAAFLFSLKHTGALLRKPASSSTPSLRILNCIRVYGPQVKPGPASSQPSIRNCFAVIYALRTPSFNEAIQFVMRLADSGPLHPACPVIHHSRILIPMTKMKTPPLCPRRLLHRPSSPSQPLQLL